ncbi:hypothetical protein TVAG_060370 [Trichomonas vaginalis G3]|uniref:Uncharacterized protein n=1 Tax=Trichomonas vaginalis (strain ATCC PRA-98 / G3) TaxID=412133 RepID=A2ECG6_TRIV3|nr:positive regulation of peptidyl-threonine phosphorylation [Trichomonas vaginalis G3]EAY09661.1 hypothetical protein TVAG_060370 [Trichomonas vaginalis G3]KAI5528663.1 positive regulation of peptidyl-threonine phosphorylation [Trichomonas vaginalis G3]|eukprot:XP_001321884.1 hypothetical protein [Trichomonas vaginalis G3]
MNRLTWIKRIRYSSLQTKLNSIINSLIQELNQEKLVNFIKIIEMYSELFNFMKQNNEEFVQMIIKKLYSDDTIENIIFLMKFLDQTQINKVSTFLQSSSRELKSKQLPVYLMRHTNAFDTLISYLADQKLASTANILIRECIKLEKFSHFLFCNHFYSKLFQLSTNENFEISVCAIKTFQELFNTYPKISSSYVSRNYAVFSVQLITILSTGSYIVRATMLPFLVQYMLNPECSEFLDLIVADKIFLMLTLKLMSHKSHKIYTPAYSIFKIIIFKQSSPDQFKSLLQPNRTLLLKCLKKVDIPDDEQLQVEHLRLISRI